MGKLTPHFWTDLYTLRHRSKLSCSKIPNHRQSGDRLTVWLKVKCLRYSLIEVSLITRSIVPPLGL